MKTTVSKFRANIYNLLDQVLKTREPIEIERNGQILKIIPPGYTDPGSQRMPNKFLKLKKRTDFYKCNPEDLFQNEWLKDWES